MRAAIVMSADVIEIRAVGQCVLRDDINVAPLKFWVGVCLAARRNKAFAKNHVGRAKAAGVRAAKQNGVARHFRINIERRGEHIVPEPVTEKMSALFVVEPVRDDREGRHQSENHQNERKPELSAAD